VIIFNIIIHTGYHSHFCHCQ